MRAPFFKEQVVQARAKFSKEVSPFAAKGTT